MDIESIIRANLEAINENYDELKPFMQGWLGKVETEIQRRAEQQRDAITALRSADYSVKSIAADIGASRTTIYNHEQLLKRYIEQSAAAVSASSPLAEIAKLKTDKALLQDQVTAMMERDVDMEILRSQNQHLATVLKDKNDEIERLQKRISELSAANNASASGTRTGTVKTFKRK